MVFFLLLASSAAADPPVAADGLPPLQEPNRSALRALLAEPPADPASAPPADWPAVLADSARFRGRPLRITARYAGRQRAADADGVALTEWGLVADANGEDLPLVIYLPRRTTPPPARGVEVSGVARFLALWDDADAAGEPRRYPVLVARDLGVTAGGRGHEAAGRIPGLLALGAALAAGVWFLARRVRSLSARTSTRPARVLRTHARGDGEGLGGGTESLPADPAEALARLADGHPSPHPPLAEAGAENRTSPPSSE